MSDKNLRRLFLTIIVLLASIPPIVVWVAET